VTATTSNGTITVKQAKGQLKLKSAFGDVRVETPGGEVTAETANGKVVVRGATGRLRAKSSFGSLELAAERAVVSAETSNGTLAFAGSLADGEHTFRNTFGDVTVTLPADAQFRLDARTDFGAVATGFRLAVTGTADKTHLKGTVGDNPAVVVKASTSNGAVRINPAK
jgi:DUF4097 and DUF4098 domain-containing protein YvlB